VCKTEVIRDNQQNVISYEKSCGERSTCNSFSELECSQQTNREICDKCSTRADGCFCPGKFSKAI